MKKILLTGSNGFIGSLLYKKLTSQNYQVTCLVRNKSDISLLPNDAKIVRIDYNDINSLKENYENNDVIIHNAGRTKGPNWLSYYRSNFLLTKKLYTIYNETESPEHFIFISSQAAAGVSHSKLLKNESSLNQPLTYYGKSKLIAENYIKNHAQKPWTIIRPASVYGPGDKDFLVYFKMIKNRLAFIPGKSEKFLSLIYVNDLVNTISSSILNHKTYNEVFFASDGKKYELNQFIHAMEKTLNTHALRIKIPEILLYIIAYILEFVGYFKQSTPVINVQKVNELIQQNWLCDNLKSQQIFNTNSTDNLLQNLKETYQWYKEKNWL